MGGVSVTLSVVPIGNEIILDRVKGYLVERGRKKTLLGQTNNYFQRYVSEYVHEKLVKGAFNFYLCGTWKMIRDVTYVIDKRFPNANIYSEGFCQNLIFQIS